ncbi:MAG: PEP-utilizing enzyme [Candidatus Buchananbacteria bacterium]
MKNKMIQQDNFFIRDWVKFSFNGVPIYLNLTADSGFKMKRELGYGYRSFLLYFKGGYSEMNYEAKDLESIWQIINKKLGQDKKYLLKIKNKYNKTFSTHKNFYLKLNWSKIKNLSDDELVRIFNRCVTAQIDSCGTAHLLDAVSIEGEKIFRELLFKSLNNQEKFNKYFPILIMPSKPAFVALQEIDLGKIKNEIKSKQGELLNKHYKKYFWFQNSYAGSADLSLEYFQESLRDLKIKKSVKAANKKKLIKVLKLNSEIRNLIGLIDFCMVWQDERKANILMAISYLSYVLQEISQRLNIDLKSLVCFSANEAKAIKSLNDFKQSEKILKTRRAGVYFLVERGQEKIIQGQKIKVFSAKYKKIFNPIVQNKNRITGFIANGGTAIGRVKICNKISDLSKFKLGDVLVTSMTRPEFLPAIKKASAIITDEGGITSHAAIIAREFNIPAVIGTKIGTKIFKDGMLVEVRANHGAIKIINYGSK